MILEDSHPSASLGSEVSVVEVTGEAWDPVRARRSGMMRASAGVLEQPWVGPKSFDHVLKSFGHARAGCAEGCLNFRDVLALRPVTVVV